MCIYNFGSGWEMTELIFDAILFGDNKRFNWEKQVAVMLEKSVFGGNIAQYTNPWKLDYPYWITQWI